MSGGRYKAGHKYKRVKRPVTPEDKMFIKLVSEGVNRTKAFRLAYPDHPTVRRYMDAVKTEAPAEVKKLARTQVTALSKDKLQTNHIQSAMTTYVNRMEELADDALETVDEIMNDKGASKKVRADLAMEMIRHRVGTPTQKVQVQEEKNIFIGFGGAHPDDDTTDIDSILEGEVIE